MAIAPSIIFMPDISGFTKFVQNTEIEHSQHIISELLELLIDQNQVDLKLAEIEGDALFYYKHSDLLSEEKILAQAKRMYQAFHKHLEYYENNRICNCGACRTTPELELKFVVHGGPFDFIKIKDSVKPYGPDVIKAHRLLKNDIKTDEYVLISEDLFDLWKQPIHKEGKNLWASQTIQLDMGPTTYKYMPLVEWRKNLHELPDSVTEDAQTDILNYNVDIEATSEIILEYLSNLKYRSEWSPGVDEIEYEEGRVNRAGTKHVCVIGNKNIHFETIKPNIESEQLVYAERTEAVPGFQYVDFYFILNEQQTGTNLELKLIGKPSSFLTKFVKPLIAYKVKKQMKLQIGRLKEIVEFKKKK